MCSVNRGSGGRSSSWCGLGGLGDLGLDLLCDLVGRLLDLGLVRRAGQTSRSLGRGLSGDRRRLAFLGGLGCRLVVLLIYEISEDVVENIVTICLGGEDERLCELLVGLGLEGYFANYLNEDVGIGGL